MEIKKEIFADLAVKTPEKAILATNTSALSITELGAATGQSGRVIGLHFFNPVSRMKPAQSRRRETDDVGNRRARARFHPADRQAAGGGSGQPGLPRQSRPLSLSARRGRALQEGRERKKEIDDAMDEVGNAHGALAFD